MPLKSLRSWLGVERAEEPEYAPLRELLDALERIEPDRARHLAAFAYLLGRVARADLHVSPEETHAMEAILMQRGELSREQAMLVVALAKTSNLLFGGTANFLVAREFAETASYEEKLALLGCLFGVSTADGAISTAEESEISRVTRELRIEPSDLIALRLEYRRFLPGLSGDPAP